MAAAAGGEHCSHTRAIVGNRDQNKLLPTGVKRENIEQIVEKYSTTPEGFHLHRGLERTLKGASAH